MTNPDNDMCMRPTHVLQPAVSQFVAAHESHDNDELPAYEEIIRNADEETKHLIETAYYADEKNAFGDNCELPAYEKVEKFNQAAKTGRRILVCTGVVVYVLTFMGVVSVLNNHGGCM